MNIYHNIYIEISIGFLFINARIGAEMTKLGKNHHQNYDHAHNVFPVYNK